MSNCDVCIIGGGVPGMALAALLGRAGLSVVLVDAQGPAPALESSPQDGRTVALMGASIDTLAAAGVWPLLADYGSPLRRMAVVDDSRFPAGADAMIDQLFDAGELGRDAFGWNLALTAIRAALAGVLKKTKTITHLTGATMTDFAVSAHDVKITINKDRIVTARLIVGCDGRDSKVRGQTGIEATRRAYGQKAITCIIGHTRAHNDTSVEFHRPGGPFTIVPMQDNSSAIVWVEHDADADAFLKLPRQAFANALQERTRDRVGKIDLRSNPSAWPLEFLRAKKLVGPRTALAAEAAHVISPIGAQGLNLSLRDVAALADIVTKAHALGLDVGSTTVLDRYARARKGDVLSRSLTIDLANQAVANDSNAVRALRRLALRALSLPGPWRALVMKKGLAA